MVRCLAMVAMVAVASACSGKHEDAPRPAPAGHAMLPDYVPADAAVAPIDANPLLSMFGPPAKGPSSADQIAKLEEQARRGTPAEKVMIERMIAALRELDLAETDKPREREHAIAGTKMMVAALEGMLDDAKADANTERTLISSLSMVPFQVENLGIGDAIDVEAIRKEAFARGRALVKAFPRDARAWKMLGWLETQYADDHGSSLPAIRAYVTCAKLDPSIAACASTAKDLKERWVEAYCPASAIKPGIGWYEQGVAAPRFTSKDLVRLRATVIHIGGGPVRDGTTGQVIDQRPDEDRPVVVLELAPAVVAPLAKWEGEVQDRSHFHEIRFGDRLLATTKDSYITIQESPTRSIGRVTLDELCTAPEKRALPADID